MRTLAQHRKDKYVSVRDLSRMAQVSATTIWRIENGKTATKHPGTMRKIADALGVHPSEITEFVLPHG